MNFYATYAKIRTPHFADVVVTLWRYSRAASGLSLPFRVRPPRLPTWKKVTKLHAPLQLRDDRETRNPCAATFVTSSSARYLVEPQLELQC